jgi:TolB-like protein/DNA-binding winged helix-turn-helix (wHTH) protein
VAAGSSLHPEQVRFGPFEFDTHTFELKKSGRQVRLRPQAARVLAALTSRAGHVVTRDELRKEIWGNETFVDFENGMNLCVRQIREALHDDADVPRYIETLPRRGYRFIAPVESKAESVEPSVPYVDVGSPLPKRNYRHRILLISLGAAALAVTLVAALHKEPWRPSSNRNVDSLAVLPLRNLSHDPEQEYFSDGMTDELITELAKIPKLRVISHASVERYRETKRPLPEIARELRVDAIVEGTVTRSGERVRVTAQLIDAHSDQHIWAESYERDFRDILALQDQVAAQIASEIGLTLTAGEHAHLATSRHEVNPAGHEAYLKGSFYFDLMTCRDFENALTYFQEAIAKDSNFAPAYSGLADTYFTLGDWRCWHVEPFDKAQAAASRAIELDPRNARAHAVLAEIGFARDWNWRGPAEQFGTAVDLDPNDARVHAYYGMFLVAMGKVEQGLAEERKAQELDPFSENTNLTYTWTLYLAHRFDAAIENAKHALSISPSYGEYYWLGQCYEKKNMPDEAIEFYLKVWSDSPKELPLRRAAYQRGGLAGYWREDERLRRRRSEKIDYILQAMYHAHRGEKEKAIKQLELAYREHCDGLQFLKVEPVYDDLRDDPRFKQLLARLGL